MLSPVQKLLAELISIPSVNPEGVKDTSITGEKGIAEWLCHWLKKQGADVKLQAVLPGRPNVIACWKPKGRVKRRVLLAPHTDTVSVEGMTIDPFKPRIHGGKMYGRGASDTKGSLAAMLIAVTELRQNGWPEGLKVTFVGLADEEGYNAGAKKFVSSCPDYDLVIVGEPTGLKIVHETKGTAWVKLKAKGKACHASAPENGTNALVQLSEALLLFCKEWEKKTKKMVHPALGKMTCTPTKFQAGSQCNIVPDVAEAWLDIRYLPQVPLKSILASFGSLLGGVKVEFAYDYPPLYTSSKNELLQKILPFTKGFTSAPWFCDASYFSQKGLPAVALGPGSMKEAHTKDEFIALKDLEQGKNVYLSVLKKLSA